VAIVAWHLNFGVYVQPINCRTVPKNKERLRITPTPLHSDADTEYLVEAVHWLSACRPLARAIV
jgi:5-aminolevulinate synthase